MSSSDPLTMQYARPAQDLDAQPGYLISGTPLAVAVYGQLLCMVRLYLNSISRNEYNHINYRLGQTGKGFSSHAEYCLCKVKQSFTRSKREVMLFPAQSVKQRYKVNKLIQEMPDKEYNAERRCDLHNIAATHMTIA